MTEDVRGWEEPLGSALCTQYSHIIEVSSGLAWAEEHGPGKVHTGPIPPPKSAPRLPSMKGYNHPGCGRSEKL